jgi:hypothetical protein
MKYTIIILLFPIYASAQSVTYAPMSMKMWGTTPSMGSLSVEYKGFEAHYFAPFITSIYEEKYKTQSSFAVSYKYGTNWLKGGVMYAFSDFPIESGSRLNFIIELGYNFNRFGLYYRHISNGFGIQNRLNPGVDHFVIRVSL